MRTGDEGRTAMGARGGRGGGRVVVLAAAAAAAALSRSKPGLRAGCMESGGKTCTPEL